MSLQDIINSHAENMVARHNQIESLMEDQAATRANNINEKTKAIGEAYEQLGTTIGSTAGAYHLGRTVYRAYKKKGLKGAAKRLADAAKESKGKLSNIKPGDDDDDEDEGGEGGEGDAPTRPTGTDLDDPDEVSNRLDSLLEDAKNSAIPDSEPNVDANQDPRDADASQPEAEASEPQEINIGGDDDPEAVNLDFKMGSVAEPEDLQVARYNDMAQRVFDRNRAKGLDIEGRPLPEGVDPDALKPAERVLADVSKKAQAPQGQPENDPSTTTTEQVEPEEAPAPAENQPLFPEAAEATQEDNSALGQAKRIASQDTGAPKPASDEPLSGESTTNPSLPKPAEGATEDIENLTGKVSNSLKTGAQDTGNLLKDGMTNVLKKGAGEASEGILGTLGEVAEPILSAIPVVGEVAGLGLGIYGLIESIFGKHSDDTEQKKLMPVSAAASAIDPQAIVRGQQVAGS